MTIDSTISGGKGVHHLMYSVKLGQREVSVTVGNCCVAAP